MEKALFGAGCFWGVEDFFLQVPGVSDAVSGYAGGTTDNPSYKQVCNGDTNHAEVVEVTFDPAKVSYAELVDLFFRMHNPTQLNRQGPDFGTQYRSVIFTHNPEQARIALERPPRRPAATRRPLSPKLSPRPHSGGPRIIINAISRSMAAIAMSASRNCNVRNSAERDEPPAAGSLQAIAALSRSAFSSFSRMVTKTTIIAAKLVSVPGSQMISPP